MGARTPRSRAARCHRAARIGVLTNIGEAHLEIMGHAANSRKRSGRSSDCGARAVLNADDTASRERAASLAEPPHWFAALDDAASFDAPARATALLVRNRRSCCARRPDARATRSTSPAGRPQSRATSPRRSRRALELGAGLESMIAALPGTRAAARALRSDPDRRPADDHLRCLQRSIERRVAALDAFARERGAHAASPCSAAWRSSGDEAAEHARTRRRAAAAKVDALLVGGDFAETTRARCASAQVSSKRSCGSRRTTKRAPGCARTRGRTTSCCSRARACTGWSRSSRS